MVTITTAQSDQDLMGIVSLMQINLQENFSPTQQSSDGFLSLVYAPDVLRSINQAAPSIIAKDAASKVVGYSLVVVPEVEAMLPDDGKLVSIINQIEYGGKLLRDYKYYIMGQVCVAQECRGQMVFDRMFDKHRELYADRYQLLVTCISNKNVRSLRAHTRVGFEIVYSSSYTNTEDMWHVVVWDWQKRSPSSP